MRRLYLQIYLTLVASLVVFAIGAGVLWRVLQHYAPPPQFGEIEAEIKGKKVVSFKYRRRKASSRRKTGHRQRYLRVRITAIETA